MNQQDELKLLQSDFEIKSERCDVAALLEQTRDDLERMTGRMAPEVHNQSGMGAG